MTGHGAGYRWNLRELMADQGITSTTELMFRLRGQGVELSPIQVTSLVTQPPERLSVRLLLALCEILDCTSARLIEPAGEVTGAPRAGSAVPTPRTALAADRDRVRGLF